MLVAHAPLRACTVRFRYSGQCNLRGRQAVRWGRRQGICTSAAAPALDSSSTSGSWTVEEAGSRHLGQREDLHVVLVHPQIPQNAGSAARTCAATNTGLHLVKPLGFEIDSLKLKRAGLDYWPFVVVKVHEDWAAFHEYFKQRGRGRLIAFSKFGKQSHTAPDTYHPGDWLLFGAETSGLPAEAHEAATHTVRIPMSQQYVRSLNLAVSVGVGIYEASRQLEELAARS